jgi:hypothetical protein
MRDNSGAEQRVKGEARTLLDVSKNYVPHKEKNKQIAALMKKSFKETMKDKSVMMKTFRSSTREVFHGSDRECTLGHTHRMQGGFHTHFNV